MIVRIILKLGKNTGETNIHILTDPKAWKNVLKERWHTVKSTTLLKSVFKYITHKRVVLQFLKEGISSLNRNKFRIIKLRLTNLRQRNKLFVSNLKTFLKDLHFLQSTNALGMSKWL